MAIIVFAHVTTWSVVQDIGRSDTATLTGFITLAGNMAAGAIPLVATLLVTFTGSWNSSFQLIAAVSGIGCFLWLFVDPNRPLKSDHMSPHSTYGN
jgi:nitrate/nitrite transporter NarK